ncbi:hypothetical protein PY32053_00819 [Paracoccus yeei]|uniref:Uncharacterized protein n=1 Tax=Paracoccus yeei TaxID=147645 RepID=A0A386UIK6_9RHOB|nr:hypothetical protein PY32053_00819 [Paracoccus yeei]
MLASWLAERLRAGRIRVASGCLTMRTGWPGWQECWLAKGWRAVLNPL